MHPCDPYDHTCVRPNWKNQYPLRRISLWKIIYSLFLPKESRRKEMNAQQEWIRPIVVPYAYEYSSAPITLRSSLDVYNQKCFVSLKNRKQKKKNWVIRLLLCSTIACVVHASSIVSMLAACFGQVNFSHDIDRFSATFKSTIAHAIVINRMYFSVRSYELYTL